MNFPNVLTWRSRLAAACAIGLAVWALRVALIVDLGTGIPYWDQWDREGLVIYEPWLCGQLTWRAIFEPHLEHRIVWTHLWNLGLFEICGQWDPMVQMVAQAGIPAVTAGLCVWGLLTARIEWYWRSAVLVGTLFAFGSPLPYGNILWGFQSQFGFLVALSLAGCAGMALVWRNRHYSWLALFAGLAAPLAMGAGALAGPIVIAVTILVALSERKLSRLSGRMLAIGLVCSLWGQWLRSDSTVMMFARAESVAAFVRILLAALAWPNCDFPWLAGLACLPVAVLAVQVVRRKITPQPSELFLVGIYIWSVGCAAGGAWTRGGLDRVPPSRYVDFLALLCLVNFLALVLVLCAWWQNGDRRWRAVGVVMATAWFVAAIYGGSQIAGTFFKNQRPAFAARTSRQFEAVNGVLGGAPVSIMIDARLQNVPAVLERVMTSSALAPYLPPEIQRVPKNLTPDGALAIGQDGPHGAWRWQSGIFDVRMAAMIMFVRGEEKSLGLVAINTISHKKTDFQPSGRHIGPWSEWLVRTTPGPYEIVVEAAPAAGEIAFILPRPLSAPGYWIRNGLLNYWLMWSLAGFSLVVALFVCRARARGGNSFGAINADA